MGMTLSANGRFLRIVLDGDLSVRDVRSMFDRLVSHAKADTVVSLSASGVTRIDTAIVQLVAALARCVSAVEVETESAAWRETWQTVGLTSVLRSVMSGEEKG